MAAHVLRRTLLSLGLAGGLAVTAAVSPASAAPGGPGSWSSLIDWSGVQIANSTLKGFVSVHLAVGPSGDVLMWDREDGLTSAKRWDPNTGAFTNAANAALPTALFCAFQTRLPGGKLIVVGGTALEEGCRRLRARRHRPRPGPHLRLGDRRMVDRRLDAHAPLVPDRGRPARRPSGRDGRPGHEGGHGHPLRGLQPRQQHLDGAARPRRGQDPRHVPAGHPRPQRQDLHDQERVQQVGLHGRRHPDLDDCRQGTAGPGWRRHGHVRQRQDPHVRRQLERRPTPTSSTSTRRSRRGARWAPCTSRARSSAPSSCPTAG